MSSKDVVADRIRELRIANGLTQEELGEKLGLQKSAIAKYESGRVENIKRSTLREMARVLGCRASYLVDDEPIIQPEDFVMATPTPEEREVLEAYRQASNDRKDAIRLLLGLKV